MFEISFLFVIKKAAMYNDCDLKFNNNNSNLNLFSNVNKIKEETLHKKFLNKLLL